ncbi:unnamed protein product [Clonostachys rosea]|uniref:DUF6604 domain-containing protein n=1 Tax=Bionectria ochroleuca TaxID=29856 RepID=A0ABY6UDA9_BIOOC|nr:unnamed protein product [Clonostachys rosea]
MLPDALVSVYRRYKADTDALAGWLALTAKSASCPPHLLDLPSNEPTKPTGRLKGKARKMARLDPNEVKTHIIPIKSFIPLAEYIASAKKPRIEVPESVINIATRVIRVRSQFSARLSHHGAEPSLESDQTHSHFVDTLKQVLSILKQCCPAARSQKRPSDESIQNSFSLLAVEEPSQCFLDATDAELPPRVQADDGTVCEAEPQNTYEDTRAAYAMLLSDLNKIRQEVKRVWLASSHGAVDVSAAGVVSNTGIDLARYLIDQVLPLLNDHGGAYEFGSKYGLELIKERGHFIYGRPFTREMLDDFYKDVDETMLLAVNSIKRREMCKGCSQASGGRPWSEVHDQVTDMLSSTPYKIQEDNIICTDFYSDLMDLLYNSNQYPIEDESVRGIRELREKHESPFYLAFAAQIILDIHHTLGPRVSQPLTRLTKELDFMDGLIDKHYQTDDDDLDEKKDCACLRNFQSDIKYFQADPTLTHRNPNRPSNHVHETSETSLPTKHRILKLSPLLCGIAIFSFRAKMHDVGFKAFNRSGSIQHAVHLYNALVKENLVKNTWVDMQLAENFFGERNIFAGKKPSDTDGYLKQLMLMEGMTVRGLCNIFNTLRGNGHIRSGNERRRCKETKLGAPVSNIFIQRYSKNSQRIDLRPEDINEIISRRRWINVGSSAEDQKEVQTPTETSPRQQQVPDLKQRQHLSPHELLRPLANALTEESFEIAFPRLLMHKVCWEFLHKVTDECGPDLDKALTQRTPCDPKNVVSRIFSLAVIDRAKGLKILRKAAKVVEDTLESRARSEVLDVMENDFGLSRDLLEQVCAASKLASVF